jgi:hypothetical protein
MPGFLSYTGRADDPASASHPEPSSDAASDAETLVHRPSSWRTLRLWPFLQQWRRAAAKEGPVDLESGPVQDNNVGNNALSA